MGKHIVDQPYTCPECNRIRINIETWRQGTAKITRLTYECGTVFVVRQDGIYYKYQIMEKGARCGR